MLLLLLPSQQNPAPACARRGGCCAQLPKAGPPSTFFSGMQLHWGVPQHPAPASAVWAQCPTGHSLEPAQVSGSAVTAIWLPEPASARWACVTGISLSLGRCGCAELGPCPGRPRHSLPHQGIYRKALALPERAQPKHDTAPAAPCWANALLYPHNPSLLWLPALPWWLPA